ncbi:MAG TPA: hypothetical protein VN840_14495 [Streptosporangiaceae bacterium]|nr:hypothetical protein [Streptosporangiaceae bacterium]
MVSSARSLTPEVPCQKRTPRQAASRLASHGYRYETEPAAGPWVRVNVRDLADLAAPVLPAGFRFRTAGQDRPLTRPSDQRPVPHVARAPASVLDDQTAGCGDAG